MEKEFEKLTENVMDIESLINTFNETLRILRGDFQD